MTTTPEPTDETWSQTLLHMFKWMGKAAAWVLGLAVAVSVALSGYDQLDLNGYIHHERTIDVYMSNNWLVGENRICWLIQRFDANEKPTGQLVSLQCPVGDEKLEPHNLPVTFKGIVDPKDINGKERAIPDEWSCKRGSDNFTCDVLATPVKPSTP
jgi:hypothetical protein